MTLPCARVVRHRRKLTGNARRRRFSTLGLSPMLMSPSKMFQRSRPQSKSDSPDQDEEQSSIDATPETSPRLRKLSSFQRLHLMPHLSLSASQSSTSESKVLIERLGGQDAVRAIAETLLDRTSKDALLAPFYEGVDVKHLVDVYTTFLVLIFDGPGDYEGQGIYNAHRRLVEKMGLADEHFDRFTEHLSAALAQCNVSADVQPHVLRRVAEWKDPVLGQGRFAIKARKSL